MRLRDYLWPFMAVAVVTTCVVVGTIYPSEVVNPEEGSDLGQTGRLLTQCLDKITDDKKCVPSDWELRECCVKYPSGYRVALCDVQIYKQFRPDPLPPSIYYVRYVCGNMGFPCTPMIKLECPTPKEESVEEEISP